MEALCVVVTGKRRLQDEKDVVKGEGAFQQRRGYVQRLGGGGSRLVRLGSRGEKGRRGPREREAKPEQAGHYKGKPIKLSLTTPGCCVKLG